tara:strand:+ start:502 stop:921 length:420 start_codon:yes stop_codon:yes gene_type:complete
MIIAREVSYWSKDPSTKVGSIIVDHKRRIVGTGYNGFPRGVEDTESRLNDRPTKYSLVVHAEANAILNSTLADLDGCTLYVTHAPCTGCAKLIIQSGIKYVFSPQGSPLENWAQEQDNARTMMIESGIELGVVDEGWDF